MEDIERIAKQYDLPASPAAGRDDPGADTTRAESSPARPDKGPRRTLHLEDLLRDLNVYLVDLVALLNSPRHKFCSLVEGDVPEAAGLYAIYGNDPPETLYVGKADNLRFRIMKNHLAYKGDDNFVKYLMQDLALTSRSAARAYIRRECSSHWVQVDDPQRLFILEHLAIAAARPRYNRG
jgi:hypothetical protein